MIIKYFDNFQGIWQDITGTIGSSLVITENGFESLQINKKYLADLTQSSTTDPTIDFEYYNTIGVITWTRNSDGDYNGYCLNGFIGNVPTFTKVFTNVSFGSSFIYYEISKIDNNNVSLIVRDKNFIKSDDALKITTIEISIY
jgi:hypothetical protein